jgi:hypothetical protein
MASRVPHTAQVSKPRLSIYLVTASLFEADTILPLPFCLALTAPELSLAGVARSCEGRGQSGALSKSNLALQRSSRVRDPAVRSTP